MAFRRKRRTFGPNMKMAEFALNNVNWDFNKPNLVWRSNAGDAFATKRLMSVAAGSLGEGEAQPNVRVKKIVIEASFLAGIGKVRASGGDLLDNVQGVRDDVPEPGITAETVDGTTVGLVGALLSGTIDNSALDGPTSWVEGMPANLWLGYEDNNEFSSDPDTTYGPFMDLMQNRNKTVFWSKHICPTAYNPAMVRISKTFPGRGLMMRQAGQREIVAITLFISGYTNMGTVVFPVLTMCVGRATVWYTDD